MPLRPAPFSLHDNLAQHLACTESLLQVLAEEKNALNASDLEGLTRLCAAKAEAASTLQGLSQRLGQACGGAAPDKIEAHLAAQQDPQALARWRQLLALAARCQRANLENGALLLERQARVRSLLQVLQRDDKPLYGRAGAAPLSAPRRALATA